jgi:hypothetical protein
MPKLKGCMYLVQVVTLSKDAQLAASGQLWYEPDLDCCMNSYVGSGSPTHGPFAVLTILPL